MSGLLKRFNDNSPRLELDYWHKGGWRTTRFDLDKINEAIVSAKNLIDDDTAKYFHLWRFDDGIHPVEVQVS